MSQYPPIRRYGDIVGAGNAFGTNVDWIIHIHTARASLAPLLQRKHNYYITLLIVPQQHSDDVHIDKHASTYHHYHDDPSQSDGILTPGSGYLS